MATPFPQLVVEEAWKRSNGICECENDGHGHSGRCTQRLVWMVRGGKQKASWEAHAIDPDGERTLENCRLMCMACHKALS